MNSRDFTFLMIRTLIFKMAAEKMFWTAPIYFFLLSIAGANCPDGFMSHGRSCYMDFGIQATFTESQIICQAYGGYLANINDEHEQHFIQSFVSRNIGGFKPGIFWLGATDLITEGEWFWTNTSGYMQYKYWAPGEPNNARNAEHCLEFDVGDNFHWNDNACESRFNFVCEIPASGPSFPGGIIG